VDAIASGAMAEGKEPGKEPSREPSETAKRQQKRRKEKLKAVQQQIDEGSLKIRKMTPEERKKYPPQDRPKKKR
jgi:hypothetical protein